MVGAIPASLGAAHWYWLFGEQSMADRRAIMRIQVDAGSKEELDEFCDKRGMTQIAVISRLVGWFIKQDEVIKTAVMASLSDDALSRLAKQMLKRLEGQGKNSK
jgi:hypothetical protein